MHASLLMRLAGAAALVILATPGWAGGRGGHGPIFHAAGFHGGGVPMRGFAGGGSRGGVRGVPPVSGVIHERFGTRPYYSAYGHTNTAMAAGGYRVPRVFGYGHTNGGLPASHAGQFGFARYGHTATAYGVGFDRPGLYGRGARAFGNRGRYGERLRLVGRRRRFLLGYRGGYGGIGNGYGGDGGAGIDGGGGVYAGAGTYGGSGTYGWPGTYGNGGTYGGGGAYAGGQTGVGYASEAPLAARFAEPPLAPSPFAPPGDGDRYAYAASEDVGYASGPRIITVGHPSRPDCRCAPRISPTPVVYRYGVGTAY